MYTSQITTKRSNLNLRILTLITAVLALMLTLNFKVQASEIKQNQVVDKNKIWTLTFNQNIDLDTLKSYIVVTDLTTNNNVAIGLTTDTDITTTTTAAVTTTINEAISSTSKLIINPPTDGYTIGDKYRLSIKAHAKSATLKELKNDINIDFSIANNDIIFTTAVETFGFGININISDALKSQYTNITKYQVYYKNKAISSITDLGELTTCYPIATQGDSLEIHFLDANNSLICKENTSMPLLSNSSNNK